MANRAIEKYIDSARAQHASDAVIKEQLIKTGWSPADVDAALGSKGAAPANLPPPPAPQFGMWVTFQYAVFFICLYIIAVALASLLDRFVDQWFPAVPPGYNFISIQFQLSSLIVAFPIFALLFVSLRNKIAHNPAIRGFKLRKQLVYITLFIAAIIVIVNLIWNITDMLSGNFTMNSFGHLIVLLLISGSIFFYFLWDVREDRTHVS